MSSSMKSIHETVSHGKKTFPFTVYHARIPDWLMGFPLHWHDEFELIYITCGQGIFTVNGKCYLCKEGDLVVIPPGAIHSIERNQEDCIEYFNILFSFSLLEENSMSLCYKKFLTLISEYDCMKENRIECDSRIGKMLASSVKDLIDNRHQKYSGYELMIKSQLYKILYILFHENLNEKKEKSHNQKEMENARRLKKILLYTREHFTEKISIDEAAKIVFLSPSRFMAFFKSQTNTSFVQYLINYRLEIAAEEIIQSRLTITEIAMKNGFENISYFIRSFKKKFGKSPLVYRKNLQKVKNLAKD
ncbi:MAG: AraC family transcriptional regulator [Treponema sp.]|nr:AraC family transcriptional regulator [Treponema sp.]